MATKETTTLVPVEKYLSAGAHIGTKFKTKSLGPFIYKVNPAGLYILNVHMIDERLKMIAKFLAKYDPEEILVICRRENGWKAVKTFAKLTKVKYFTGRYPAGVLTNPELETFIEPKVILICDPWPDKNAVHDAKLVGIPIIGLCDTNNTTQNIDIVIPCNNKGSKSLALIFWILSNQFLKEKGSLPRDKDLDLELEDFGGI